MIAINIDKAKNIAHGKRRQARSTEFAPLDIKATIPSEATVAEADRQIIRDKYAEIQTAINNAETVDEIKTEMDKFSDKLNGI
jgi:3-methyladenine DNA glycosylase Tag